MWRFFNKIIVKPQLKPNYINVFKNREKSISFDLFKKYVGFWPQSKKKVVGVCDVCECIVERKMCYVVGDYKLESLKNRLVCKNCTMAEVGKDVGPMKNIERNNWKTLDHLMELVVILIQN